LGYEWTFNACKVCVVLLWELVMNGLSMHARFVLCCCGS
jgi:hypothetical protein